MYTYARMLYMYIHLHSIIHLLIHADVKRVSQPNLEFVQASKSESKTWMHSMHWLCTSMDAELSLNATNFCCHCTFAHKFLGFYMCSLDIMLHRFIVVWCCTWVWYGVRMYQKNKDCSRHFLDLKFACTEILGYWQVLKYSNDLNEIEFSFFLFGGQVFDRSGQAPNPSPDWINQTMWDNIVEADSKLESFKGQEREKYGKVELCSMISAPYIKGKNDETWCFWPCKAWC